MKQNEFKSIYRKKYCDALMSVYCNIHLVTGFEKDQSNTATTILSGQCNYVSKRTFQHQISVLRQSYFQMFQLQWWPRMLHWR